MSGGRGRGGKEKKREGKNAEGGKGGGGGNVTRAGNEVWRREVCERHSSDRVGRKTLPGDIIWFYEVLRPPFVFIAPCHGMKSSVFIAPYHFSRLWTKIETNISDILFNFSGMGIIEGEKFLQKFGKIYCIVQPFTVVIFFESSWQFDRTIGAISTTRFRFWTGLYVQIHPLQYFLSGNILTRAMSCPGIISVRRTVPVLDSRGITKNIN